MVSSVEAKFIFINFLVQRHPDHGPDGTVFWAVRYQFMILFF